MTERKLPPALEAAALRVSPHGQILTTDDLLNWLYGKEVTRPVAEGDGFPVTTPSLVERVEERLYEDGAQDWQDALRTELGEDA